MTDHEYDNKIRTGCCPECDGSLDPAHLPHVYTHHTPSAGWQDWRVRTCYDCGETFGYYLTREP